MLPGRPIEASELRALDFRPHALKVMRREVPLLSGAVGCEWVTVGDVPKGPGLYAFTVERDDVMSVAYVGLTEELWMVTQGKLPSGRSRPGQRYGKPKWAGVTRQRINVEVAQQFAEGNSVRHWVRPMVMPADRAACRVALRAAEEQLIRQWELRTRGWNRG